MLQELRAGRAAGSGAAAAGGAGVAASAGTTGSGTLSPSMLSLLSSGQQSGWAASLDGLGSLGSLGSLLRSGEKSGVSARAGNLKNCLDR